MDAATPSRASNSQKSPPQVLACEGNGALSTFSQSLAFHSSPDAFLFSRQNATGTVYGRGADRIVRARILNRDVLVIPSYTHCKEILAFGGEGSNAAQDDELRQVEIADPVQRLEKGAFSVLPAYKELMVDFFPAPNLLLTDLAGDHLALRRKWDGHMAEVCGQSSGLLRQIATDEISTWPLGMEMDLYDRMKDLSWKMLLAIFLHAKPGDKLYSDVVGWQENLLRGQFSLFPVSVNTPFWRSPRSRGLDARQKLQKLFEKTVSARNPECPFRNGEKHSLSDQDLASNLLLFTSSIAVKAVASLLTASMLNLHLFGDEQSLAARLRAMDDQPRQTFLTSILRETERLSPPVIGVMRRVEKDVILRTNDDAATVPETLLPQGWDAWLYFVGANRNESIYPDGTKFIPERFTAEGDHMPDLTFGYGDKSCLGRDVTRQIVETVATMTLDRGIDLQGSVGAKGVQAWLGWDDDVSVEDLASDLKQLPCQRPRKPIKVRVVRAAGD